MLVYGKKIIHQSFKQIWWLISWQSNQIVYGTYSNKNKMVNDMQWTLISWVIKYFVYETTYIVQKTCYLLIAECSMKYARAERKFFADRITFISQLQFSFLWFTLYLVMVNVFKNFAKHTASHWSVTKLQLV